MSFDYSNLKARMALLGITQKALSEATEISENTISEKLSKGLGFKPQHINKICKELDIDSAEVGLFFFKPSSTKQN